MPKRTTREQRLVKKIYQSMATAAAKVEESQEITERGRNAKREIDLLLEQKVFGTPIRIAVEVRGRKRKDTLEWIDVLVGKYKDMNVQKIIAISASGFTGEALNKARDEHIDTLTLAQAEDLDWPNEFTKIGIARVVRTDSPHSANIVTDPPMPGPFSDDLLVGSESEAFCKLSEFAQLIYSRSKDAIGKKLAEMAPTLVLADLQQNMMLTEIPIRPANPTHLHLPDGSCPRITSFTLRMLSKFQVDVQKVQHYVLGDQPLAVASVATLQDDASGDAASWTVVQTAGNPGLARLFSEPVVKPSAKKPRKKRPAWRKRGRSGLR
jgi:hypothetical protein